MSVLVNRTIDDFYGDEVTKVPPSYLPIFNGWNQGNICTGCIITPATVNISQIFNGTWHDSTWHVGDPERVISMNFTGVAVYAFVLLVNQVPDRTTFTNLTFRIDGELAGNFMHLADNTTEIFYNVPAFGLTGLPSAPHLFEIHASGANETLVLFDYAIYTAVSILPPNTTSATTLHSTPSVPSAISTVTITTATSSKKKPSLPSIIGGVVGGATFIIIGVILLCALLWRRLASRTSTTKTPPIYPHVDPSLYHAAHTLQSLPGDEQSPYLDLTARSVTCTEDATLENHISTLEAQLHALTAPKEHHRPSSSASHHTPPETQRAGRTRDPVAVSQEHGLVPPRQQHLMTRSPAGVPSTVGRDSYSPRAGTEATYTTIGSLSATEVGQMRTELASLRIALVARRDARRALGANADEPLPEYSEQ